MGCRRRVRARGAGLGEYALLLVAILLLAALAYKALGNPTSIAAVDAKGWLDGEGATRSGGRASGGGAPGGGAPGGAIGRSDGAGSTASGALDSPATVSGTRGGGGAPDITIPKDTASASHTNGEGASAQGTAIASSTSHNGAFKDAALKVARDIVVGAVKGGLDKSPATIGKLIGQTAIGFAPIYGQALAVAETFSAINDYRKGEGSVTEILLSAAGAAPGFRGATTSAKAIAKTAREVRAAEKVAKDAAEAAQKAKHVDDAAGGAKAVERAEDRGFWPWSKKSEVELEQERLAALETAKQSKETWTKMVTTKDPEEKKRLLRDLSEKSNPAYAQCKVGNGNCAYASVTNIEVLSTGNPSSAVARQTLKTTNENIEKILANRGMLERATPWIGNDKLAKEASHLRENQLAYMSNQSENVAGTRFGHGVVLTRVDGKVVVVNNQMGNDLGNGSLQTLGEWQARWTERFPGQQEYRIIFTNRSIPTSVPTP